MKSTRGGTALSKTCLNRPKPLRERSQIDGNAETFSSRIELRNAACLYLPWGR